MLTMHFKVLKTCAAFIFAALAVALLIGVITSKPGYRRHSPFYDEARQLQICSDAVVDIYDLSGNLIPSMEYLRRTSYYPYKQNFPYSRIGATYKMKVEDKDGLYTFSWTGFLPGRVEHFTGNVIDKVAADELTTRRMKEYVSGVKRHTKHLIKIRQFIISAYRKAVTDPGDAQKYRAKEIPVVAMKADIPGNQKELNAYIKWLCLTEGLEKLEDAWGHELVFTVGKNLLGCRSAGLDGLLHTNDDIVFVH